MAVANAKNPKKSPLTPLSTSGAWLTIKVDEKALEHNVGVFRDLVAAGTKLLAVVKADAYGHGLLIASRAFLRGGADMLGVHSLTEAESLRQGGIDVPILVLGPLVAGEIQRASELGLEITVGSLAAMDEVVLSGVDIPVHLKVETGVNRQGIVEEELPRVLKILVAHTAITLVGLSSHFADIEDTTDHQYAHRQMSRFQWYGQQLEQAGFADLQRHMSCSAATLLWDESHGSIARLGISAYGVWPSRETLVSVREQGLAEIVLVPALTWEVRISQVRQVPAGETVGYGRSWKAMTDSRIAVLPVGYSDGWPRALSGRAHVLVHGKRAPLVGRICMNLCMVDVTHIPEAAAGDAAVLLGIQGEETITVESLASHLGTISYEVLTLPGVTWRRVGLAD
jgi:alanine racemase